MRERSALARPIPILRYLAIGQSPTDPSFSVDAALFGDHLDALIDRGYIPMTVQHLVTAIGIDAPIPARAVAITFDHALRGFYEFSLPALRNRDIPSTLFVATGFVGR
jgi:peptidoglycan/xylan/chitin deacetylase (PgdA/CDA1 family)